MTMHLVGPYMTTTRYNRKQKPSNNKRNIAAQAEHDKWLRKMNAHPDQIKENKKKNAGVSIRSIPDYRSMDAYRADGGYNSIPTSDVIPGGSTAPAERRVYSGERKLLGVAIMHKSNMVPVFDSKDAKDIAKMRRG